ncbi:unnamed protein product [Camellia sinensis]
MPISNIFLLFLSLFFFHIIFNLFQIPFIPYSFAHQTIFYSSQGSIPITILHTKKKKKKKKTHTHNTQRFVFFSADGHLPTSLLRLFRRSFLLASILGGPCRCCLRVSHATEHVHSTLLLHYSIWRTSESEHHGGLPFQLLVFCL